MKVINNMYIQVNLRIC